MSVVMPPNEKQPAAPVAVAVAPVSESRPDASGIARALGDAAACAGRRPALTLLGLAAVTAVLSAAGLAAAPDARFETDPLELWVPRGSLRVKEMTRFETDFSPFYRVSSVVVKVEGGGEDSPGVLTQDVLLAMLRMQRAVESISVTDAEGTAYTMDDLCLKPTSEGCVVVSALDYWSGVNGPSEDDDVAKNIMGNNCDRDSDDFDKEGYCSGDLAFSVSLPYAKSALGAGLVRKNVLGGITYRSNPYPEDLYADEIVASAKAAMISFLLDVGNRSEREKEAALLWETAFEATVEAFANEDATKDAGIAVEYRAERSLEDELEEASKADAVFVIVSYLLVLAYACAGTAKRGAPLRALVGAAGVALTAMATMSALGLCALAGVFLTPLTAAVLPFVLLAVGVNDMFVLVSAGFDCREAAAAPTVAERCGVAARRVGTSTLTTSACNAAAFAVGASSKLPAASSFCSQAAVAIALNFLFSIVGVLAACALVTPARKEPSSASDAENTVALKGSKDDPPSKEGDADEDGSEGGWVQGLMHAYYPRVESSPWRYIVIVASLGIFGAAMYGVSEVELGLQPEDAVPRGSRLSGYFLDLKEYFEDVGPPLYIVNEGGFVDGSFASQVAIEHVSRAVEASEWIGAPLIDWHEDVTKWFGFTYGLEPMVFAEGRYRIPEERYASALVEYLATPCGKSPGGGSNPCGSAHSTDVFVHNVTDTNGDTHLEVGAGRIITQYTGLGDTRDWAKAMNDMIDLVTTASNGSCYPYSIYYPYFEQYVTVEKDSGVMAGLALLGIFVCVLVIEGCNTQRGALGQRLMRALRLAAMVSVASGLASLAAVGLQPAAGVHLNALSAVNVAVAIGLAVEGVCHMLLDWEVEGTMGHPTGAARARAVLERMGSCTFSGGFSTLLGVVVLAGSRTPLFEVYYFRAYACVIAGSMYVGLVFLPAVLSVAGDLSRFKK